jgi:hypothetical protein
MTTHRSLLLPFIGSVVWGAPSITEGRIFGECPRECSTYKSWRRLTAYRHQHHERDGAPWWVRVTHHEWWLIGWTWLDFFLINILEYRLSFLYESISITIMYGRKHMKNIPIVRVCLKKKKNMPSKLLTD